MNFLLHHAFARAELGCPLAAVGAMLPDLWRMAHPRVRARVVGEVASTDAQLTALTLGIAHHLDADRWFHRCDVFVDGERDTAALLRKAGVPKLGLFAHVSWEMCLDGAWVQRSGAGLDSALRDGWALAGALPELLARTHGAARLSEDDQLDFTRRMMLMRSGLSDGEWIRGYADAEGLFDRLEGMRVRRFGLHPMTTAARALVTRALDERLACASTALDRLRESFTARPQRTATDELDWRWAS